MARCTACTACTFHIPRPRCGGTGIARFFPGIPQALSDLQNGTLANPLDVHPRTSLEDPNAQPAEGETPDGEVTQQEG